MSSASPTRPSKRELGAEDRRQAILDAALAEFSEKGFEGARLDDIARRAGVAKGTIYLLARDKTDLFEKIALQALQPMLIRLSAENAEAPPSLQRFRTLFRFFLDEILATDCKLVAQIVLKEAGRFPEIARFYHREIIARILGFVTDAAQRAERDGLLASKAYARFPQLVVAPMVLAMIWDAQFGKIAPLDAEGLIAAHFEALFGAPLEKASP